MRWTIIHCWRLPSSQIFHQRSYTALTLVRSVGIYNPSYEWFECQWFWMQMLTFSSSWNYSINSNWHCADFIKFPGRLISFGFALLRGLRVFIQSFSSKEQEQVQVVSIKERFFPCHLDLQFGDVTEGFVSWPWCLTSQSYVRWRQNPLELQDLMTSRERWRSASSNARILFSWHFS